MPRPILDEAYIHPTVRAKVAGWQHAIVQEVESAVQSNDVVVVGMAMNPFPAKARKALDAIGQRYKYLEYGSYFALWRPRGALKMWTGWPTLPMVFVKGVLVGGFSDLRSLIDSGEFQRMLVPGAR